MDENIELGDKLDREEITKHNEYHFKLTLQGGVDDPEASGIPISFDVIRVNGMWLINAPELSEFTCFARSIEGVKEWIRNTKHEQDQAILGVESRGDFGIVWDDDDDELIFMP